MDTAMSNPEFAECSATKIKAADARMTAAWRKLLGDAGGSKTTEGHTVLVEQRAWIAFRTLACREFFAPDAGREAQVLHGPLCIASIINDRAKDLEARYLLNHQDQINP
jgi:uncharacterized protein YecT (DUF1311 family)